MSDSILENSDPMQQLADVLATAINGKKKDRKPKEQKIFSRGWTTDYEIVEEIFNAGEAQFARYNTVTGEIEILPSINKTFPTINGAMTKGVVLFPSGIEDYGSQEQLVQDIITFLHKYVDVDPWFEKICAYYILLTWMQDKLDTMPYLGMRGDQGTGKSRSLIVCVGALTYRPFRCALANEANIYRIMDDVHGTMLFEEFIPKKSSDSENIIRILNAGFERNNFIPRCNGDKTYSMEYFDPFGAKLLCTRGDMTSNAFESRCITCISEKTDRVLSSLPKNFKLQQEILRNKLLKWRLENWHTFDTDICMKAEKELLTGIEGRIKQVYLPFMPLIYKTEFQDEFIQIIKSGNEELKDNDKESAEGKVFRAWIKMYKRDGYADSGSISTSIRYDESLTEHSEYYKPHYCGHILKALKFTRASKKARGTVVKEYRVQKKQLIKLLARYSDNPDSDLLALENKGGTGIW